jgi:hypothetical protein
MLLSAILSGAIGPQREKVNTILGAELSSRIPEGAGPPGLYNLSVGLEEITLPAKKAMRRPTRASRHKRRKYY